MYVCMCVCAYVCMCVYVYVCMCVCVYIYTLFAHTHTCQFVAGSSMRANKGRGELQRGHPWLYSTVKELETAVKELETKVSELSLAQDRVERLRRYTSDRSVLTKQPTAKR